MRISAAIFLAAGVAGCGDDGAAPGDGVTIVTRDGKTLSGHLVTSAESPAGSPGVLLIHQFQQSDAQWGGFPGALAAAGFRVLTFDLRGHGESDPYDGELASLLTDREAATADRDAALAYLVGDGEADPSRVAIVGTSIGANLTVAAAIDRLATTYVSLSANQERAEGFSAGGDVTGASSVFYLAATGDATAATSAQAMFDASVDPRDLRIYEGSSAHGIAILNEHDDAAGLVLDWLDQTL